MKQLNADGTVSIPSNLPRNKRGPDSRGIRICFAEIGRSCSLQTGYLIFTDGSAYEYTAPGNTDVEQLCAALQRGKMFNFQVRRTLAGYIRGFTPPADYETIYTYPPYPGVAPVACGLPMLDWTQLYWTVTNDGTGPGQTTVFAPDPGLSDTASQTFSRFSGGLGSSSTMESDLTYAGASQNANCHLEIADPTNTLTSDWTIQVLNAGVAVFTSAFFVVGSISTDFPFTIPDEMGAPTNIHVFFQWEPHTGGNVIDWSGAITLSNV